MVQVDYAPDALKRRPQWVMWRYVQRGEAKPTKVPHTPEGRPASHNDPSTWSTFDQCYQALDAFDGVGFVFTADDPYVGIDLDNCFDERGSLLSWAVDLVTHAQEQELYIERTPSGRGLHIIGCGRLPGKGRKVTGLGENKAGAIEVYDQLRYFTVTGDQLDVGDAGNDASTLLQQIGRQYLAAEPSQKAVEQGTAISDALADNIANTLTTRASFEFLQVWRDMYDVAQHGSDRSAVRMSLLTRIAGKLKGGEHPLTVELLRAVALRSPFIQHEMTGRRGHKWPRLAADECAKAIAYVTQGDIVPDHLVLTLPELYERAGEIRWSVKGLVPDSALGMIFGASGTFKSFIALDYGLHRAHGLQWCGRKTKPGIVVYLAAEGGAGIMRRVIAWHQQKGLKWADVPFFVVCVPLSLRTEAKALADAIKARGIKPTDVIVDTLSQTYDGDENAASEMSGFFRAVGTHIRDEFGCTVTIVHHTGHAASERPRGSSAILANLDFVFGVYRTEGEMMATVEVQKQKDGERAADLVFLLSREVIGKDEDGDEISSLVASHADSAERVLESARRSKQNSISLLLQAIDTGRPEKEVRLAFYRLLDEDNPDTRKKAYQRAKRYATESGMVTFEGDFMLISERGAA